MSETDFDCPQCGEGTDTLNEGVCEDCRTTNQVQLDRHNSEFDRWKRMSVAERDKEIGRAIYYGENNDE